MPLILPGNVASATADAGYNVDNSCRFNDGDSAYMSRAASGSITSNQKFTLSLWVKRGALGTYQRLYGMADTTPGVYAQEIYGFGSDNTLYYQHRLAGSDVSYKSTTNMLFRDVGAWYHTVLAVDTTQATDTNRVKIYVNGTQVDTTQGGYPSTAYIPQNNSVWFNYASLVSNLGALDGAGTFDGYIAEAVLIDGQQLTPTSFGEFDSDSPTIWKPIDVSGLTFGTNGFYCKFSDSADLGADSSGNSNDFTVNNLDATDSATDVPTNNFATLNILDNAQSSATYSEGNCKWVTTTNSKYLWGRSTIGMSAGKWYAEFKATSIPEHGYIGICVDAPDDDTTFLTNGGANDHVEYGYKTSDGNSYNNTGSSSYGDTYTDGDIIGVYLDLDNNKLYFAKNGTIQNSGTGISITAAASNGYGNYFFCCADGTSGTSGTFEANFGGCPAFTLADAAITDDNDYGNFEYDPSDGGGSSFDSAAKDFLALCTKNLAEFG